jgi:uncharacterized metal-binding protein
MPELPKKKIGLVSCSGEEMAEGTITRLATRKVLETLRPGDTTVICLPLFLAGGEGDRAFAKVNPTITIDGCEVRCAAKGTERYSAKPAASVVVTEICKGPGGYGTARHLNEAGIEAVDRTAKTIVANVDRMLGKCTGSDPAPLSIVQDSPAVATCSCGSGIPVQVLEISGRRVEVLALPLIFNMFHQSGKSPGPATSAELMETVRLYNSIPESEANVWSRTIEQAYAAFCDGKAH